MDLYRKIIKNIFNFASNHNSEDKSNESLQSDFNSSERLYKNTFKLKIKIILSFLMIALLLLGSIFLFKKDNNHESNIELKDIIIEESHELKEEQEKEDYVEEEKHHNYKSNGNKEEQKVLRKNKVIKDKKIVEDESNETKKSNKTNKNKSKGNDSFLSEESSKKVSNVYITEKGSCYHFKKCGKGNYYSVSLSEAKEKGLRPCKRCCK